jgi:hypothetical protein
VHDKHTNPFQNVFWAQMHVFEPKSRICPEEQVGIIEQTPLNIVWPGGQVQLFAIEFHTRPLLHLTQALPFQFESAAHPQAFRLTLQTCPLGQLIQLNPFH